MFIYTNIKLLGMKLKVFKEQCNCTEKMRILLDELWKVTWRDFNPRAFKLINEIQTVVEEQKETQKHLWDDNFPSGKLDALKFEDFSIKNFIELVEQYPYLLRGNEDKYQSLLNELKTQQRK